MLFLDLDRFKVIDDSLGHAAGDLLLEAVAERLSALLRPGDTVARFGGDEFTVLCDDLVGVHDAVRIAGRIVAGLAEPLRGMRSGARATRPKRCFATPTRRCTGPRSGGGTASRSSTR